MRLDMLDQDLAEDIRPGVVFGDADLAGGRFCKRGAVALVARNGRQQVDPGEPLEGAGNGQQLRLGEGVGGPAAEGEGPDPGRLRGMGDHDDTIGHDGIIGGAGPVPFQHGEFGQMQVAALAVAEHPGELEDPWPHRPPAASCRRIPGKFAGNAWHGCRRDARSRSAGRADGSHCPGRPEGRRFRPRRSPVRQKSPVEPR